MTITVNVAIPALDALVAFLEGTQQAQIDALAAQVETMTAALNQHTTALQAAEQTQQEKVPHA